MTLGDFSEQADAYAKARPGYSDELLDLVLADMCSSRDSYFMHVADIGAGTGIFTKLLVDRGLNVTAVEPGQAMRDKAVVTGATWIAGTFEQTQLPTAKFDWVVAAQAFHWADPPLALPELRRILKPNGMLTFIWNNRLNEESELLTWTQEAIRRLVPEFDENYRVKPWETIGTSTGDFEFVSRRTVRHSVIMTKAVYRSLWQSTNRLKTIAGSRRLADFLSELDDHLQKQEWEHAAIPYECEAWNFRSSSNSTGAERDSHERTS